jgi:GTP-binding protein EngB required for normal cell division
MKIVMIGNTGVGKTTYMASLYGALQREIEGFSLKAVRDDDHSRLYQLAKQIDKGKYPALTDQRSEYDFSLRHKTKDIIDFSWADYRGGAITSSTKDEQTSLLISDLKNADGIMMFCDCDALERNDHRSNQIGRMATLVNQALQNVDHIICLGIVFTKVDKVRHISDKHFNYFQGLISAINASEYVFGSFIPIACGLQLINVPMPLLFTLYGSVIFKMALLAEEVKAHYAQAEYWIEQSKGLNGFFRWVGDSWNGYTTDEQMAVKEYQQSIQKYEEHQTLVEPVQALIDYVQKLPLIQDGKNLQDYAHECANISYKTPIYGQLKLQPKDPFAVFK